LEAAYYLGCDVSVSSNPNADFSVFTVGERVGKQPLRVVHVVRVPGKTIDEQGNIIKGLDSKYNFSVISITGQIDCHATLWWNSILSGLEIGSNIAIWYIAFSIFSNNRII
jgi:hypothetical protein